MHRHLFAPILPFVTLLISISIHIPSTSSADDQYYTNCLNSYECGDITVTYPFWGAERPVYCGYPGFVITCQSEVLTITISTITYRVLAIDNSTQTLTVARQDYWENYCPTYLINTILDPHIFSYSSTSRNLTLYYGCPSSISALSISNQQYSCKINETDVVGYYMTRDLTESELAAANSLGTCKDSVKVPIFGSAIETLNKSPSLENLHEAIDGGFGLKWAADNSLCEGCDQSGGQCGRNVGSGEFICYCAAGPYASRCGYGPSREISDEQQNFAGKGSNNTSLTIGLAVAGAAIAAGIVICFLFFCVRQRRKKLVNQSNQSKGLPTPSSSNGLPTPTSNFSRTTPTYFSSSQSNDIERGSMYFGVQVFTYNELEEATDNFDPSRELGDGGFGVVYYGKLHDGRVVAVKRLYENSFKRVEQFINEVEILARLRHPNLVTLYGCTSKRSPKLILVYEYIPNGTVADHLHGDRANSGSLTWPVRLSIAIETADALTYLHRSDIIHRDVKTNNILLDNEFRVKVADFGLSRLFPTDVTHVSTAPQGTPGYVDPEYHQSYQLTDKSDVYSFGVVLVELITSLQAVDITRHRHDINLANMAINKIQNDTLHELVDPCLGFETDSDVRRMTTMVADLAFRCLQQDRDLRPSMEEVLETLKVIEKDEFNTPKPEVVDIRSDHVGLLKNMPLPPPFSPESVVSAKWTSSSTAASSF